MRWLALFVLASSSLFARTHVFFGVGIGGYAPPPPVVMYAPPPVALYAPPPPPVAYMPACPGPGSTWIGGYWYPVGPRYYWHAGYWSRPPYAGAYWAAPRHHRGRYYGGSWRR